MKVTFEGIKSGDYECFCWAVNEETYIRITGNTPKDSDRNKFHRDYDKPLYNLYISDIIGANEDAGKQTFTIEVEE